MNIAKLKSIDSENIFCFCYATYLIFSLCSTTFLFQYYDVYVYRAIKAIYVLLLFYIEFRDKSFNQSRIIGIVLCLLLYLNASYIGGVLSDSLSILLLYTSRHARFEKIARLTNVISIGVLLVVIILAKTGVIENYISTGRATREYLGFLYCLFPSVILFNITCLTLYLSRHDQGRSVVAKITLLVLGNVLIYSLTVSRLSFMCSIFLILCFCLFKVLPGSLEKMSGNKAYKILSNYSYVISCVLSVLATILYNPEISWMSKLNHTLEGRLSLETTSFYRYGFNLFGIKDIPWVGAGLNQYGQLTKGEYLWVDNLYIHITQQLGIVFMLVILILITVALVKCYQKKKYLTVFILGLISLRCLIDDLQMHLFYNTFLFIIPKMLLDGDENKICDDCQKISVGEQSIQDHNR